MVRIKGRRKGTFFFPIVIPPQMIDYYNVGSHHVYTTIPPTEVRGLWLRDCATVRSERIGSLLKAVVVLH